MLDYQVFFEDNNMVSCHFERAGDLPLFRNKDSERNGREFNKYINSTHKQGERWLGPRNMTAKDVTGKIITGDIYLYEKYLEGMLVELDKSFSKTLNPYTQEIIKTRRKRRKGKAGDSLDIHKVYQGQLDKAWEFRERKNKNQQIKLVTLFVDVGGLSDVNAYNTLWRAAVAVKLQRDFQKAGIATKIISGNASTHALPGRNKILTTSIIIKNYQESLSLQRVAAMTHIGFFRTFCFAAKHAHPYGVSGTLGRSIDAKDDYLPINIKNEISEGKTKVIYVGRGDSLLAARNSIKSIYDQLEKLKV